MTDDRSDTARRRFLQVLGAGTALGIGASTTATASGDGDKSATPTVTAGDDDPEAALDDPGLITAESDADFETTVARVEPALEVRDLLLVATIDHAENAESADMDLPPTTLFLFGNPAAGTPLMRASRSVAIDLPQKLLVWEADGQVFVTYNDPRYLARRHDLEGVDQQLTGVADALADLASAVAGTEPDAGED
ncbi:DUF302 domain-containing protein [Haloterrigena sp. SYSU A558-1]|uniref:DUF302 domain-containing protein n=1 Tax=Haloterrigena gelatinilytica TaxID=2741724 RepID=A0A8J8GQD7_9EURY|nr:DUF302 domain-containing protein [Haloterrigena gelatinilytica]NUB91625.1 DUF302 domain-containing protein [Haloterrigena gelatinilytica]NUC72639.1 DUF302 domain-containing protein [Haloterrigena gelatinilytica]